MNASHKIRDVMTRDVVSLEKEQAIPLAKELMRFHHVQYLPILDHGRLVGLVSPTDLFLAHLDAMANAGDAPVDDLEITLPVGKIMTTVLETASPEERTSAVMERMVVSDHRCLPVVEDGKFVGLVSDTDLLRVALDSMAEGVVAEEKSRTAVVQTESVQGRFHSAIPGTPKAMSRAYFGGWLTVAMIATVGVLLAVLIFRSTPTGAPVPMQMGELSQSAPMATQATEQVPSSPAAAEAKPAAVVQRTGPRNTVSTAERISRRQTAAKKVKSRQRRSRSVKPMSDPQSNEAKRAAEQGGEVDERRRLWMPEPIQPRRFINSGSSGGLRY